MVMHEKHYDKRFNCIARGASLVDTQEYDMCEKQETIKCMIAAAQEVLNDVWKRMKMEVEISETEDKKKAIFFDRRRQNKDGVKNNLC